MAHKPFPAPRKVQNLSNIKEAINQITKAFVNQIHNEEDPLLLCMRPAGSTTTLYAKYLPQSSNDIKLRFVETIPMDPEDWEPEDWDDYPTKGWDYGYDIVLNTEGYLPHESYFGINILVHFFKEGIDDSGRFIYHASVHGETVESNKGKQFRLFANLCKYLADSEDPIDLEPVIRQLRDSPGLREDNNFDQEDLDYLENNSMNITYKDLVNGDWDY